MEIATFLFHCSAVSRLALCIFLIAEKHIDRIFCAEKERAKKITHSSEARLKKNSPKVYVALCIGFHFVFKSCAHSNWIRFFFSLVVFGFLGNILAFIDCEQITVKRIANHKLCLLFNEMLGLLLIYLQGTKPTPKGTSAFYLETSTMDRRPTLLVVFFSLLSGFHSIWLLSMWKRKHTARKINDFRYFTFQKRASYSWPLSVHLSFKKPK